MGRIAVAKNFYLDEFIDPFTYFKTETKGQVIIDKRLYSIAQLLRDKYGKPIYINNWYTLVYEKLKDEKSIDEIISLIENTTKFNGTNIYKWSGIRTSRTDIGSKTSAHRKYKAIDPKGDEKKLFKIIKENAKEFYDLGVRRVEDISITPGWLHIDTLIKSYDAPNRIKVIDRTKITQLINIEF